MTKSAVNTALFYGRRFGFSRKAMRFELTNLFYLSAIFVINHGLQLARCLPVGSALAEKAPQFWGTGGFNISPIFVINHDLQLARCLSVGSALAEKSLRFELTHLFY